MIQGYIFHYKMHEFGIKYTKYQSLKFEENLEITFEIVILDIALSFTCLLISLKLCNTFNNHCVDDQEMLCKWSLTGES